MEDEDVVSISMSNFIDLKNPDDASIRRRRESNKAVEVSQTNNTQTVIKISSTNDLTHPKFRLNFQLFGLFIMSIQMIVLSMIISNSYKNEVRGKNYENAFSFLFTTAYLSNYASDNISSYLDAKLKMFQMPYLSGIKVDLDLVMDHKTDSSVMEDLIVGFQMMFAFTVNNCISSLLLAIFLMKELFLLNPEVECELKEFGITKRIVRMLGIHGEVWTMVVAMLASCLVSASGKDMLEKVFSFGAVLVVLEFDDLAVKSLPDTFFTPNQETVEVLKKTNFVNVNCVQGIRIMVCAVCLSIYVIIYLSVLHK